MMQYEMVDPDFDSWMDAVDMCLQSLCGLRSMFLADCEYRLWWLEGYEPFDTAQKALDVNNSQRFAGH